MRFFVSLIAVLVCFAGVRAYADDKGDDETQSTKNVYFRYGDNGPRKSISSSISYSTYLTKSLNFTASTDLANSYNKDMDFPTKTINFSTSISYTPQDSRLSTDIGYSYRTTDSSIAGQGGGEEYATYDRNIGLTATVAYKFTNDLRASMDMNFTDYKRDNNAPRESRDNREKENKSVGTTVNYNITSTTNMSGTYHYSKTTGWELSRSDYFEMFEPPLVYENSGGGRVSGRLQTSIDATDNFHISTNINVYKFKKVDKYDPSYNTTNLSGDGLVSISYTPHTNFKLLANASFYRNKIIEDKRAKEIKGYDIFNRVYTNLDMSGKVEWQISDNSRLTTDVGREYSDTYFYDKDDPSKHPGPDHPNAENFKEVFELYVSSFLIYTISERLSLQISHYYKRTDHQYRVIVGDYDNSNYVHNNNFNSSIRYEFSDSTTSLVSCGMNNTNFFYYDESVALLNNNRTDNISLNVQFLQDVGDYTQLDLSYYINQYKKRMVKQHLTTSESLIREVSANISFLWGVVQPTLGGGVEWIRNNMAGYNSLKTYTFSPGITIKPTENFTVSFYFNYSRYDNSSTDDPDLRNIYHRIHYDSSISYLLFEGMNISLSMDRSATETYSTFSGSINYTF